MKPCNIICFFTFLNIFISFNCIYGLSPEAVSKEEQLKRYKKLEESFEPFQRNITECARQVRASMSDVDNFLKRLPQQTMEGKCFVACILKRNLIIKNNKVVGENLLELNRAVYGKDSEVIPRMSEALRECEKVIDGIFEICEYASMFNDCMHMKLEHIIEKVTMDRRMEALGQLSSEPDEEWDEDEEDIMKLLRDEL